MKRRSFCEWMPMLPWPMWPLAEHARLGQNTVVGSMTILLSWLCWGACQEKVCLDPRFLCNLTPPRFSVELPIISKPRVGFPEWIGHESYSIKYLLPIRHRQTPQA